MNPKFKSDPKFGQQMAGFAPCPISGDYPYIKVDTQVSRTGAWATARLHSGTAHVTVQAVAHAASGFTNVADQLAVDALAKLRDRWNAAVGPETKPSAGGTV